MVEAPVREISTIVNEGPVGPGFRLENTIPLVQRFNQPETLINFSILDEVGKIASGAWNGPEPGIEEKIKSIWEEIRSQQAPADGDFERAFRAAAAVGIPASRYGWVEAKPAETVRPARLASESVAGRAVGVVGGVQYPQPEPAVLASPLPIVIPLPQPRLVEQILQKYAVKLDDRPTETFDTRQLEEVEEITARYVEDTDVSVQRKYEITEAIRKAKAEIEAESGKKEDSLEIEGWRIVKFVPRQYAGNECQIVRHTNHVDGSLAETYEELASRKFTSEMDAHQKSAVIVDKIKPVKKTRKGGGNIVSEKDIARVYRFDLVKSPAQEVLARIIKKQTFETKSGNISTLSVPEVKLKEETRVEDNPDLAEVFNLAA